MPVSSSRMGSNRSQTTGIVYDGPVKNGIARKSKRIKKFMPDLVTDIKRPKRK